MIYSYTQISQYLACPKRYRYRYLDRWREKDTRAAMVFGRVFEEALGAYFRREDSAAALFQSWAAHRDTQLDYSAGDNWDKFAQQGVQLLDRFAQEDRVRIRNPRRNLQRKVLRQLAGGNEFVAYVDALGRVEGTPCLIEWKTSSRCYQDQPAGLVGLDPQLVCYSWMTGIAEVALVVFVRKRMPEIQYLRATISDEQREEFARLVDHTIAGVESAMFPARSGIRFPQNACTSCPYIGLCLNSQALVDSRLVRGGGSDVGLFDELCY